MKTGLRFFLAMVLMLLVFVVTNRLFPPVLPDPPAETGAPDAGSAEGRGGHMEENGIETLVPAPERALLPPGERSPERLVTVETPLYRIVFTDRGAAVRSIRLPRYESFAREGPVELVPSGAAGVLAGTWQLGAGSDRLDLTRLSYVAEPADGIRLGEGGGPRTLTFRYEHPNRSFASEIRYTFRSDSYVIGVEGRLPAEERAAIFVNLGPGLAINELREADDRRMMAFSGNHVDDGIRSRPLAKVNEPETMPGPLRWAGVKSKYFLEAILAGDGAGGGDLLAGIWAEPVPERDRAAVLVGMPVGDDGTYAYRAYLGPIDRDLLADVGDDLHEVNPIGWAFFRPIIRPFVAVALWTMRMLHDHAHLTYGWVLIVIGLLVRVVLWPLNQKAMRSQLKNMAAAPLMEEIRRRYKSDPQKMQQETLKLYKEQGINPLAGCVPLLIPWPMLIALFFVFQNTIQLRGQSFMWLADLSAPDPFYVLPVFLAASLFVVQWISMRATAAANPQMKMMMYLLPIMMLVIFWRLASGLNLYYASFNLAMIPQQILIARERKKAMAASPLKPKT
ncbi:MAG: membrane protein insertase YidC [Gemmatimonadota bacterium]|nr:membrane protein insertase YidC [Gemmatimonadota bacterium]